MGAFKIAGKIVISAGAAILGLAIVRKKSIDAQKALEKMKKTGTQAEIHMAESVAAQAKRTSMLVDKPLIKAPRIRKKKKQTFVGWLLGTEAENKKEVTDRQRDLMLAFRGYNALIASSKEARHWYTQLWKSTKKPLRVSTKRAVRDLHSMGKAAKSTNATVRAALIGLSGLFAGIGGGMLFWRARGFLTRAFELARQAEDASITFNTMLGSADKTKDLLGEITRYAAKTPFQRTDIIEGSRRLLTITQDNVEWNKKLFKTAGNIAALKPGTQVSDVSRAMVSAAYGEFESLKTLGLALRADQFKKYGKPGSQKFAKAVMEEIEKQFTAKTGGRDLVEALSTTMTGLMSTVKDNLEMPLLAIGQALSEKMGLKKVLQDTISWLDKFNETLTVVLTGEHLKTGLPPETTKGMVSVALIIRDTLDGIEYAAKATQKTLRFLFKIFDKIPVGLQHTILLFGTLGAVGVSVLTPILGVIAAIVSAIVFLGGETAAVIGGIGAVMGVVLVPAIMLGAAAFMAFRNEGESIGDTLKRLWVIAKATLIPMWERISAGAKAFWIAFKVYLGEAWSILKDAFKELQTELKPFTGLLGGTASSTQQWAKVAIKVAWVIGNVLVIAVKALSLALKVVGALLEHIHPYFKAWMSDIKQVATAFWDLIAGTGDMKASLKTMMIGIIDVVLTPFQWLIKNITIAVATHIARVANAVGMLAPKLAGKIGAAAVELRKAGVDIGKEGFLATREDLFKPLAIDITAQVTAKQPIELKLDGKKIAQNEAEVEMRKRNARDPMNPEELGFVMEGGRIRTVSLAEVGGRI